MKNVNLIELVMSFGVEIKNLGSNPTSIGVLKQKFWILGHKQKVYFILSCNLTAKTITN